MKNWGLLLLFIGLSYILYLPTVGAGFVTDFVGFLARVETHGPGGFIHSFGFPALQPVLNGFLITFYKLFGLSAWPWFLIFTGLHGINAFLVFKLADKLLSIHQSNEKLLWPILAGILFLVSPYHSEAVVWKVCFNFLFSTFLMLEIFHSFLKYLESRKYFWLSLTAVLYGIALLTFELPIIFPLILFSYLILFHTSEFKQLFVKSILPLLVILAAYFFANKFILGDWVGHYGADTHLNVDLKLIVQNAWKYTVKHLGFVRFYPHNLKTSIFDFFNNPFVLYISIGMAILGTISLWFWRQRIEKHRLILFAFLAFFIALVPVLNLFFYSLQYLENDRYGYFPTVFLALFLTFSLKRIPPVLGIGIIVLYLGFSLNFLLKINNLWASSNRVYQGLLNSYEWENEKEVYLLTLPENMDGVYMFRDHSGKHQSFAPTLKYVAKKNPEGSITEVIQYNLTNENNGASVQQDSIGNIKLELNEWGSWWWRKKLSSHGYNSNEYNLKLEGKKYLLSPNKDLENAVFLYQDSLGWKKFDPN